MSEAEEKAASLWEKFTNIGTRARSSGGRASSFIGGVRGRPIHTDPNTLNENYLNGVHWRNTTNARMRHAGRSTGRHAVTAAGGGIAVGGGAFLVHHRNDSSSGGLFNTDGAN